ncbi:unnamed protein product [Brassica oleracea]
MKYVVLLRKKILLGIQNRLPTIKRFPPRDQVMKQRVQIHHLPAMNSTTHRNVSLLLHSTTHCNVSLLLCFWEVRNSKKGGKFMGIDIVLVDEKPENHGKLKLGSYEGTMFLAYDRETKVGACRRITKHSDFEYCPTPMEHGSFTLKCLLFSLSFLSQLVQMIIIMVIDMSGESKPS